MKTFLIAIILSLFSFSGMSQFNFGAPIENPFGLTQVVDRAAICEFGDLNGDGLLDILTGIQKDSPNLLTFSTNNGNSPFPDYSIENVSPYNLPNGWGMVSPRFVDIDNDNDLDIFQGTLGNATLFFSENIGTPTVPNFGNNLLMDPFGLTPPPNDTNIDPAFGDLDNDGDQDLLACVQSMGPSSPAGFYYYENDWNNGPNFMNFSVNPFGLTTNASFIDGQLYDVDNDDDLDLVVLAVYSNFREFVLYENTGDLSSPVFSGPQSDPFGITIPNDGRITTFDIADVNGDGFFDIMIGDVFSTNQDLCEPFLYYQQCTGTAPADDPNISASSTLSCPGDEITIQVDPNASLGDAVTWVLHEGDCNQAAIANSSTGVFTVEPTATTTYAIRAEGSCPDDNSAICSSVTITYDPPMTTSLTQDGTTLTTDQQGVNYQWLSCLDNYSEIIGEINTSFTASASGTYAAQLDNGNCIDTTECLSVCVIEQGITQTASSLFSDMQGSNVQYVWLDCDFNFFSVNPPNYTQQYTPSESGNYSVLLIDQTISNCYDTSDCHSICILDPTVTQNGDMLIANSNSGFYQWINCDNNQPIIGANDQEFLPNSAGSYAVEINDGVCSITSNCIEVLDILENSLTGYKVHPNPSYSSFIVELQSVVGQLRVDVYNAVGQQIQSETLYNTSTYTLEINDESGIYFMKLSDEANLRNVEWVKLIKIQ